MVVKALSIHLGVEAAPATDPATAPGSAQAPPEPDEQLSDLATVLSLRTGQPKALMAQYVKRGRVTVGGKAWRHPKVPTRRLGEVALDAGSPAR